MTTKVTLGVVDPAILSRENHTGEQPQSSVTGLEAALAALGGPLAQAIGGLIGQNGALIRFTGAESVNVMPILGTVAQTGGVPTGALLEYGSNSNGAYIRLANGVQICWRTLTLAYSAATNLTATGDWPIAFAGTTNLVVIPGLDSPPIPGQNMGYTRVSRTTSTVTVYVYSNTSGFVAGNTITAYVLGIGRWY